MPNADHVHDPPQQHDSTVEMEEMLARRLARVEAHVYGDVGGAGGGACSSSSSSSSVASSSIADLRGRLKAAAARVAEAGERVGEAGARQQLAREVLLSSSSSSSAAGEGLGALAPPPQLLGLEEKAAVLLAQEGELQGLLDGLERVGQLRKWVDDPWPSLGGSWIK